MDSKSQEQSRLASVHFALLVDGLKRARIWSRVRELHCSCERWLGPVRRPASHLCYTPPSWRSCVNLPCHTHTSHLFLQQQQACCAC